MTCTIVRDDIHLKWLNWEMPLCASVNFWHQPSQDHGVSNCLCEGLGLLRDRRVDFLGFSYLQSDISLMVLWYQSCG